MKGGGGSAEGGGDRFLYLVTVRESAVMQNEPWRVLHTIFAGPWTLVDQNKKTIRGFRVVANYIESEFYGLEFWRVDQL